MSILLPDGRMKPFCHACQAIPTHGYCNLKGCPMPRTDALAAQGEACEHIEVGVSYGSGRAVGTCLKCRATLTADETGAVGGETPWFQMIYELRNPERGRCGWESNADLMRDAADEIERLAATSSLHTEDQGSSPEAGLPTAPVQAGGVDWSAAPYAPSGWGGLLQSAANDYLAEYVLSTDGADYEPTDNERFLLNDCIAGLLADDRFDGVLRQMVSASASDTTAGDEACRIGPYEHGNALFDAYMAGATGVHEYWTENPGEAPRGDPEFSEAARDYVDSVCPPNNPNHTEKEQ